MITVFTPTYNRAYCLSNLYESLCEQIYKEFEWIIVDDGSSDNTEELVKSFIDEQKIAIRYIRQVNGGKHRAINRGVKEARGELFFIVDSDDTLPKDSLEIVKQEADTINWGSGVFVGLSGVLVDKKGCSIGGGLGKESIVSNAIDIRYEHKVKGDMAEVWRTEILSQYPFPTFDGENFITEAVVWFRMAQKYVVKYFNKPIYQAEYLSDGLTSNIRRIHRNSPLGSMLYCLEMISNEHIPFGAKVKAAINYWRYTITYQGKRPTELKPRWWMYAFLLPGYYFYQKDIKR